MCYVCFFNGHNTARLSFVENQRRIERVIIELYSTFTSSPTFVEHLSKFKNFHSCKQAGFKSKRFRYWIWRTRWHKVIFIPLIFFLKSEEKFIVHHQVIVITAIILLHQCYYFFLIKNFKYFWLLCNLKF